MTVQLFLKIDTKGVLEVCSSISLSGQRKHRSFVEEGLVLAVIGKCALVVRLGVGG